MDTVEHGGVLGSKIDELSRIGRGRGNVRRERWDKIVDENLVLHKL